MIKSDPLWYKDAVIYELHVRAFSDANGDGIGDFKGLRQKLDYLQQLGITAIWLLPFYPSPLRDDGYDTADYYKVHEIYGSLRDFKTFLKEAHDRGIRVITELIVNHTSDQHPWFQRARKAKKGSSHRDFYVWSDTPEKYGETRIIFKDFEQSNWTWDPVAGAYYWHRFYSHQPDINFDNPAARKAIMQVMDFWFDMGVDGMRLDAVPYLFEREGTDCENLPETHAFLKDLRRHLDSKFENKLLLAEANQWPEDSAAYFGDGDECHMNFHFPLMPRLFMSLQMEDRFPIIDILKQTPKIPDNSQWAIFLRNHDELTLEMVTDEERDYMYRVYAQERLARINLGIRRRLAPLMKNNRSRIELMNGLLFSLPGTPVIYYGDELGMGDNIYLGDRDGVRTPMQWSPDRNAGFSRANPQSLYLPAIIDPEYHYETVNVEAQSGNSQSLLRWMRRIIALRKRYRAFSQGSFEFLDADNRKILAYKREFNDQKVLVIANLSRHAQYAYLDLSAFQGMKPVELFGRCEFPSITDQPYMITMSPHSFYWFSLAPTLQTSDHFEYEIPSLQVNDKWTDVLAEKNLEHLGECLQTWLPGCRWFRSKSQKIISVNFTDSIKIPGSSADSYILILQVIFRDADPESYLLPVTFIEDEPEKLSSAHISGARICQLSFMKKQEKFTGYLVDASSEPGFADTLLKSIANRRKFKGDAGSFSGVNTRFFRKIWGSKSTLPGSSPSKSEQSNTSIVYEDKFILKLIRRIDEGLNPDLEMGLFLTDTKKFQQAPPVAGHLEYINERKQSFTLGVLHGFIPHEDDAWNYTLDELSRFLERVISIPTADLSIPAPSSGIADFIHTDLPQDIMDLFGSYPEAIRLLGTRTADMHLALADGEEDPAFAAEPFTPFYRRSLYQSMRNLTGKVLTALRKGSDHLPKALQSETEILLGKETEILNWFRQIADMNIPALRIRTHGDFHLGQVLYTGRDFVIVDFEGEPARSLEERRLKRSPLRDVAGMIRSFHYAAYTSLRTRVRHNMLRVEEVDLLKFWTDFWHKWASAQYLDAYLKSVGKASFIKEMPEDQIHLLLNIFRLEKALYELGYELDNRPDWVEIPMSGILRILEEI